MDQSWFTEFRSVSRETCSPELGFARDPVSALLWLSAALIPRADRGQVGFSNGEDSILEESERKFR